MLYVCEHGNQDLLTGPLLLLMAVQRKGFWAANYVLAVVALLLLGSRTSLSVFAFASLAVLLFMGHVRLALAGLIVGVVAIAAFAATPTVSALLSVGVDAGQIVSLDRILERRQTLIWVPLLIEWWEQPTKFWFGAGHFGILTSRVWLGGITHAHNGLIDFFLDCGIILTGALVAFLVWGLAAAWRVARRVRDPVLWVLFVCVVAYLASTVTGRGFFPRNDNGQLFPILALLIAYGRVRATEMKTVRRSPVPNRGLPAARFSL